MLPRCMQNSKDKLKELARLVSPYARLYAVGSFVRDKLMGRSGGDIDICSKLGVDELKFALKGSEFEICDVNLRVGTVIVKAPDFKAEYTAFRKDSYPDCGAHLPDSVQFTDDMKEDCLRRDFKMNAIYFDVLAEEYVDILGGITDIKNKVISATRNPYDVFKEDGLRLLRLVRFAAVTGFEVEKSTLEAARDNAFRIRDIAPERILTELNAIFAADVENPYAECKTAHVRGLRVLDGIGLVDELLPELAALKGLEQNKKYHIYDAYGHSAAAFAASAPEVRWAALLHDVGKAEAVRQDGNMYRHAELGAEIAERRLSALKFPKKEEEKIVRLIRYHMVDLDGNMSENKLKKFIIEHREIIEDLALLKDADAEGTTGRAPDGNRLRDVFRKMVEQGVPMSVAELKIDGNDLIKLGVPAAMRGKLMKELLIDTALNPSLDSKEKAENYIRRKTDGK